MANSIALVSKCIPLLDEIYSNESITQVLESSSSLVRQGANAHEAQIPKISMDGLADYSRGGGYVDGDVTLSWETVQFDYDRGRAFNVDAMDNEETIGLAFGRLSGEFLRTKVIPELDAYRFAKLAGASGVTLESESISTGDAACTAITKANTVLDEAEVPQENRILFITPTLYNQILARDSYKSRTMLESFSDIKKVPQARFYTKIDLNDGTTSGEEAGGYKKATDGKSINFMIVSKPAIIQYTKHTVNKIVTPEQNQTADSWKFFFREYSINGIFANKSKGIYCSHSAT